MTFGLKNIGATYQRAMNYIFHELISKIVEIYIDDVVVKSKGYLEHLAVLQEAWFKNESKQVHFWCINWPILGFYGT